MLQQQIMEYTSRNDAEEEGEGGMPKLKYERTDHRHRSIAVIKLKKMIKKPQNRVYCQ